MILFGNPDRFCRGIGESRKFKKRISFSSIFFVSYLTQADLRHSHVAYLINQGVQPLIIKERLGHRDIKITLNTYGHLYPNQQKKVADMLNAARNENAPVD